MQVIFIDITYKIIRKQAKRLVIFLFQVKKMIRRNSMKKKHQYVDKKKNIQNVTIIYGKKQF